MPCSRLILDQRTSPLCAIPSARLAQGVSCTVQIGQLRVVSQYLVDRGHSLQTTDAQLRGYLWGTIGHKAPTGRSAIWMLVIDKGPGLLCRKGCLYFPMALSALGHIAPAERFKARAHHPCLTLGDLEGKPSPSYHFNHTGTILFLPFYTRSMVALTALYPKISITSLICATNEIWQPSLLYTLLFDFF